MLVLAFFSSDAQPRHRWFSMLADSGRGPTIFGYFSESKFDDDGVWTPRVVQTHVLLEPIRFDIHHGCHVECVFGDGRRAMDIELELFPAEGTRPSGSWINTPDTRLSTVASPPHRQ